MPCIYAVTDKCTLYPSQVFTVQTIPEARTAACSGGLGRTEDFTDAPARCRPGLATKTSDRLLRRSSPSTGHL